MTFPCLSWITIWMCLPETYVPSILYKHSWCSPVPVMTPGCKTTMLTESGRRDTWGCDPVSTEWSCHRATGSPPVFFGGNIRIWRYVVAPVLKVLEFDPKVMVESDGLAMASWVLPHWAVTWKLEPVNRKSRGNLQCSRHCLGRPEYKGVLI